MEARAYLVSYRGVSMHGSTEVWWAYDEAACWARIEARERARRADHDRTLLAGTPRPWPFEQYEWTVRPPVTEDELRDAAMARPDAMHRGRHR